MKLSDLMKKCWMEGRGEWDREEFEKWWTAYGTILLKNFRSELDWKRLGEILR